MQEEQHLASEKTQVLTSFNVSEDADAAADQAALESDMDKTVVRLNTVTEGRPLFILHGAGGGVLVMRKVAQKINYPVYGIQDTPEAPITGTLDRLAGFYLSKIKEKQPKGPYFIGGFSFGEHIAFVVFLLEMWNFLTFVGCYYVFVGTALAVKIAQILLKTEGEKVEMLIMLDGAPTLFHRETFREYTKRGIREGNLRDDVRLKPRILSLCFIHLFH
jgi:fatty acid synthase, animal type